MARPVTPSDIIIACGERTAMLDLILRYGDQRAATEREAVLREASERERHAYMAGRADARRSVAEQVRTLRPSRYGGIKRAAVLAAITESGQSDGE